MQTIGNSCPGVQFPIELGCVRPLFRTLHSVGTSNLTAPTPTPYPRLRCAGGATLCSTESREIGVGCSIAEDAGEPSGAFCGLRAVLCYIVTAGCFW